MERTIKRQRYGSVNCCAGQNGDCCQGMSDPGTGAEWLMAVRAVPGNGNGMRRSGSGFDARSLCRVSIGLE